MVTSSEGKVAQMDPLIKETLDRGQRALSEHASKVVLEKYGVPVVPDRLAGSEEEAVRAAVELGYPVVLKASGSDITHKTEKKLVAVGIREETELREAYGRIVGNLEGEPYDGVLVYHMVPGEREMVIGMIRDPQFGPCVMFGLGGIFTEILKDTSFRVAPITEADALAMMQDIRARDILGPVRGMAPADTGTLAKALVGLGNLGLEQDAVAEVDVNPLIIDPEGKPVAVDALVVISPAQE
jgi:acetate---CoA ligase (ADP-forming) subunit beta